MKNNYIFLALFLFLSILKFNAQKSDNVIVKDTLVVAYNINAPFTFIENGKLSGLSYLLWKKVIKDEKNTFYQYKQVPLDSLLLGLENGSIDIALSPLTITSERNDDIDFSVPYFISNSGGLINRSVNTNKLLDVVSNLFSLKFLKIIGYLLLLISVFGFLVWIFERKENKEEFGLGIKGILNGIWWSAVTMTTVGYGDKSPKTLGGRIVGVIWMFAAIILISSITAGITSSLTIKKMENSSELIVDYKKIKIGTVNNSATERWLSDNFFFNTKSYHTFNELLDGLRNKEIEIVAYDEPLLRYVIKNDENNEFEMLNIKYNLSMYALGFGEHLDKNRKESISTRVLKVLESPEWERFLAEYNLHDNHR